MYSYSYIPLVSYLILITLFNFHFRVLGSVGEPINPEAWLWYYRMIGKEQCSIVDTFWQTETGGHVITPLPGATPMKPGSAVRIMELNQIFSIYLQLFA